MSPYQNNVHQNQLSNVNDVLPGQNTGQQNLPTAANQATSTFIPYAHLIGTKEGRCVMLIARLIQASIYQKRASRNGKVRGECPLLAKCPKCHRMGHFLRHMQMCQAGNACTIPKCASTKCLLLHWKDCTQRECVVCFTLKQGYERCRLSSNVRRRSSNVQSYQAVVQQTYSSFGLPSL